MKTKKYYFIYETTNLVNNKKYRGLHSTNNIEDKYLGSGKTMIRAINKYGKSNFKREILEFCDSLEQLIEKEKEYVNKEWIERNDTYNLILGGGSQGYQFDKTKEQIIESNKNTWIKKKEDPIKWQEFINNVSISTKNAMTDNVKKHISNKVKNHIKENGCTWLGRKHSKETIENKFKGKNNPNYKSHITDEERYKRDNHIPRKIYNKNINIEELKSLRISGLNIDKLSIHFNVPTSFIYKKLKELGLNKLK